MSESLHPIEHFKTFNEFFYRELKLSARPIAHPEARLPSSFRHCSTPRHIVSLRGVPCFVYCMPVGKDWSHGNRNAAHMALTAWVLQYM